MLAQRRLTEAQLWKKLAARGYDEDDVEHAVESCVANGYVDDRVFAALYVEGARKAVGDARLCADLVKRGIDREAALAVVAEAELGEDGRIAAAYGKIRRTQPNLSYPAIARKLERLGFPPSLIYRVLREHAAGDLAASIDPNASDAEACPELDEGPRSRSVSR